ncbi:hypothetical protein [Lederbergia lenta]|uniref:Putative integral inner membrane protein n=1 Tax=Lederbergia lenta TaxID=1467 RepID=A0A2X4WFW9_LEDLE|nr:hypothetical protein [Lederbergia lenta]MEC2322874.1 hypothetical protein [Lederbergia lenta]SQI61943.1 putative integral inner membrane protein [Lederbergia lenta]
MNLVAWMIIACEIGFWIVILGGLITRYIFKKKKLGLFLLALTPVIDLILLIITGIDLHRGAIATQAHAIAAVYIGVSIAFGKSMIEWADERFLYYVTKQGPKPLKRDGFEHAKHGFKGWLKHVIAYGIGSAILIGLIFYIDNKEQTEALSSTWKVWSLVLGIDFLISASYFIWPKKLKA